MSPHPSTPTSAPPPGSPRGRSACGPGRQSRLASTGPRAHISPDPDHPTRPPSPRAAAAPAPVPA
eukprot:1823867-Pleurochrysis_carterae.AAC.1